MNVERFFAHYGIVENPFRAEEARHDPVFERIINTNQSHPDFEKILGRIDRPSTSVVFGEKGSGKTAIRLKIGKCVAEHNAGTNDNRILLVPYDDLNPMLDRVVQRRSREMGLREAARSAPEDLLEKLRLEDHQDAILSIAITRLNDSLLGVKQREEDLAPLPGATPIEVEKHIKGMPRQVRIDWAVLSALYDQPHSGPMHHRWLQLRAKLRLGWRLPMPVTRLLGTVLAVVALVLYVSGYILYPAHLAWLTAVAGIIGGAAIVLLGLWVWKHIRLFEMCRRIRAEMPAVDRAVNDLRQMLLDLRPADLTGQPWPMTASALSFGGGNATDARYDLTRRLLNVLRHLGYSGVMVLVDRVDEPQLVSGRPERMRPIVWPMLENKFLQQDSFGLKLLLPIELRHLLRRESSDFFQEARLDKQNLIDRLEWSGPTLYDMCTYRLRACRAPNVTGVPSDSGDGSGRDITLTDLFESDVTREYLVESLEQMHQPRDAFKFLYSVILEHCRMVPEDQPSFRIPRPLLESVRRQQSQRVQELYRGLAPA